ncbi:MAG: ribulose-phosphate 3-epimerase [Mucilaginibacter sp.]|nr:ribulose-phosphate 3-epimerase [Mucilaginibacter sp.]
MDRIIAPSVLSADFANLQRDVEMINASEAGWFHVDVMDGMFVPNISFGFPVIKAIKKYAQKPLDVHLMIVDPDCYLKDFKEAGADSITVHYEACPHLHRTIQAIKQLGIKAAVAINPATPVANLKDIIADVDMVLVMSVNPGFGGQKFIEHTYIKVAEVKTLAANANPNLIIEVDGGVDTSNILRLVEAGATALVAGSSVFSSADPSSAISQLKRA